MEIRTEMALEPAGPAGNAAQPDTPVMYLLIPGHDKGGAALPLSAQELEQFVEWPTWQ
ncbi:hypothetical protein SAMN06265795_10935 [Noviherbaspirillum humi]|uniref:Uncharacterized protein n=1 Tax=Noviherbaspirillum humi TaxID=1688639 RepID=A0A239ICF0_9BURK|nr:hypothetical protein [Noviherbaspirillum humi]SNS90948.1 hypothetical protein SAMN06265795_10935 [Noviherbaspirillum humi]